MLSHTIGPAADIRDALPTTVHWVLHPMAGGGILKLRAESSEQQVPQQGEVVRRAFLVDSQTRTPVPVRVVQRLDWSELDAPRCVVVVVREAPPTDPES